VVVNTSRGAVVDEDALCELVERGDLAGVAADVVVGERADTTGRLAAMARHDPRVLVTPHIGGATRESMEKTEIFMANKLTDHLSREAGGRR
jgi:D-3-phosphoglycerate dehydrogenase